MAIKPYQVDEKHRQPRRILICGAGIAGMTAAIYLKRAGHEVRLADAFDAPKPVGSGLMVQATGMAVLKALGLYAETYKRGAEIRRLIGETASAKRPVLSVKLAAASPTTFALGIHRAGLFDVLWQACLELSIAVETEFCVADVQVKNHKAQAISTAGLLLKDYDLVIDATGRKSPLLSLAAGQSEAAAQTNYLRYGALWATCDWIQDDEKFGPHSLTQRYKKAQRMAGIMPIGVPRPALDQTQKATFFWSLRQADYQQTLDKGLDAWKLEVLEVWPEITPYLAQFQDFDQLILARYSHHTLQRPYAERIAFIGDSAHATSPQLGQGANMAMLDAAALALALSRQTTIEASLLDYSKLRRQHVRRYQQMSAIFTPFYQSDSRLLPFTRDKLLAPMFSLPPVQRILANMVAGLHANPLRKLGLPASDRY